MRHETSYVQHFLPNALYSIPARPRVQPFPFWSTRLYTQLVSTQIFRRIAFTMDTSPLAYAYLTFYADVTYAYSIYGPLGVGPIMQIPLHLGDPFGITHLGLYDFQTSFIGNIASFGPSSHAYQWIPCYEWNTSSHGQAKTQKVLELTIAASFCDILPYVWNTASDTNTNASGMLSIHSSNYQLRDNERETFESWD